MIVISNGVNVAMQHVLDAARRGLGDGKADIARQYTNPNLFS